MAEKQDQKYTIMMDDSLKELLNEGARITDSKPSVFSKRALELGACLIVHFPGLIDSLPTVRRKDNQI